MEVVSTGSTHLLEAVVQVVEANAALCVLATPVPAYSIHCWQRSGPCLLLLPLLGLGGIRGCSTAVCGSPHELQAPLERFLHENSWVQSGTLVTILSRPGSQVLVC